MLRIDSKVSVSIYVLLLLLQTIPQGFCEHFDGKVPQQCHLQTVAGTWLVYLKKISEEFFFKKGWKDFVIGNRLKLGEFLVLHYTGNSKFYVEIYGHNYCNKRSKARKRDRSLLDDEYDDDAVIVVESDSETSINTVESETQNNELSLAAEIEWRSKFLYQVTNFNQYFFRKLHMLTFFS